MEGIDWGGNGSGLRTVLGNAREEDTASLGCGARISVSVDYLMRAGRRRSCVHGNLKAEEGSVPLTGARKLSIYTRTCRFDRPATIVQAGVTLQRKNVLSSKCGIIGTV